MDASDYGLTASDLRDAADLLYAPGDDRLTEVRWNYDAQVRFGRIRTRLRSMADGLDAAGSTGDAP
jgi:hypothetical protein